MTRSLAAALVLLCAAACGSDGGAGDSAGGARETSDRAACDSAWADGQRAGVVEDTAQRYRATLTACSGLVAWNAGNLASGAGLTVGVEDLDGYCRSLDVTSRLCAEAARALPSPSDPGGEPADLDTLTCADYFRDVGNEGERLRVTNALLRRMSRNPTASLDVQLRYRGDVERGCDPAGTGVGSHGIHVADIAERVYVKDPGSYGGH